MLEDAVLLELLSQARQGNERSRQEIIEGSKGFLQRVTTRICKRMITWNDDEMSISLIAFNEAITRYQPAQNDHFYSYAKIIIQSRLIDYFRKEGRHQPMLSLDLAPEDEDGQEYEVNPAEVKQAMEQYKEEQLIQERLEEIQVYSERLGEFGIDLEELEAVSPDRADARKNLIQVAREFVKYPHLVELFLKTKQLPLKKMGDTVQVSRKTMERGRKYIIALLVILISDDLPHLQSSIVFPDLERGDQ